MRRTATLGLLAAPVLAAATAGGCSTGPKPGPDDIFSGDGSVYVPPEGGSYDTGPTTDTSTSSSSSGGCTSCGSQQCVDITRDSKNCGGCSQVCGTGATCQASTCVCPTGQAQCNGKCVIVTTDPSNCGFCGHNCQGSTCMAGLCQATAIGNADTGQILEDMVVDTTNAYWSWQLPEAPNPQLGGLTHKPFAGGGKQSLLLPYFDALTYNNQSVGDIRGIWVGDDGVNLYATDFLNGAVFSYDLPSGFGSSAVYQAPNDTDGGPPGVPGAQPVAVSADATNVYWVDYTLGIVNRRRIDLSDATTQIASGQSRPLRVVVKDGFVYWVNFGTTQANTGSVNKVSVNGGTPTVLASGEDKPQGIATDGVNVYWTSRTNTGSVSKVSINGGPVTVLAQNQGGPWAIVVDKIDPDAGTSQNYVYWTNFNDNNIQKVPTSNTGPSTPYVLASQQNNPVAIQVDAKAVYWANQGDGSIWKVAK